MDMLLLGQSLPKFWGQRRNSVIAVEGPSTDVVHNGRHGAVGESEAANCLFELQLAQPLPIIDISRTLLSCVLPSSTYTQVVRVMHKIMSTLVWLNRINVVIFGCIFFMPAGIVRSWMPLIGVSSLVPPLCFILFLSLDVLALLLRNYEYWFISALSVVTWVGLSRTFSDSRAVVCVGLWLTAQIVASIDANYRSYQTTVKSIVMAGPSLMALIVCSAYKLIPDSNFPTQELGPVKLQSREVIIFTTSTLVIFMYKKAYLRVYRQRARSHHQLLLDLGGDRHVISCVVLQARIRLVPVIFKQRLRLNTFNQNQRATASNAQQLRLASHGSIIVDARRILLSEKQLERFATAHVQALLYLVAIVGLASTAIVWVFALFRSEKHSLVVGIVAVVCSLIVVVSTILLAQRDLVRLLVWNFDVMFSTFQATVMSFCLLDLLRWDISSSFAVVAWWLWYHWILMLDALTPSVTKQLQLRKLALPVILLVLPIAAVCAVEILSGGNRIFTSRLLLSIPLPKLGTFEVYTDTLAVQRIVTIIGWNARLVLELALSDPAQLLFIRRPVEYTSPFLLFTEPQQTNQQRKSGISKSWRSPSVAVAPTLHSNHGDVKLPVVD